jgi:hypothetical protein
MIFAVEESDGNVSELLRLFYAVQLDGGSAHEGMWAVIAHLRRQRQRRQRRVHSPFDEKARAIVEATCKEMGLTREELLRGQGARRLGLRRGARARWVAMRAMRACGYSTIAIGEHIGCHHSTVTHGLARIGADSALVEAAERVRVSPTVQRAA